MSDTLSAVQPTTPPSSTISGVLQAMGQQQQSVPEDQRGLADRLKELQERLENDPSLENDPKFATHVAWLMQDWPKFSGTGQVVQVSPLLQAGLTSMAGQYPGMSNPQMASMLQQTATMDDRQLVADIRNASVELGSLPAEQQTSFLISAGVNALEARVAQAGVVPAPQPAPVAQPAPAPQPAPVVSPEAPVVAPDVVPESVAQTGPAVAQPEPGVADPGQQQETPVQSMDNASAEHAMQDIPFGDDMMGGGSAPPAGETFNATRGEPEAQATQSAQEASPTGSEQTVPPGMTKAQEDDVRRRDAERNQGAQNTPPEQQQGNEPKPVDQTNGKKNQDKTNVRTKDVEPEGEKEENTQTAAQAQPKQAQPAQAPVGSLAGHAVSKVANVAKSWFAKEAVASDQRRIDSLVATVDGNIRTADRQYQDLKQSAAPFFKKMEETAQQEGIKPAALMASMGEGGKHYGLWQEFDQLRLSNDTVGKAYSDLGHTLQNMRLNLGSLQSEASERGATNAQSVVEVEERAGKKAMEMEDVPGRNPGESLIKNIGGALERIMEKVKARFLALTQGREQGRDNSPSMGA